MVSDRSISLGCFAAYGLWATSIFLLTFSYVADLNARTFVLLENGAVVIACGAATASVRQYFVRQNRMMRNAFELARDSARAEQEPTPIRR